MPHHPDCIFCKIIAGQAPAVRVHEDEHTLSFMDIRPASPGHLLVISKDHYPNLFEIEDAALSAVTLASRRLARAMQRALQPAGLRLAQFNGAPAGQTVFHYHVHLVPIYDGQPVGSHGRHLAEPAQLAELAARIRAALE